MNRGSYPSLFLMLLVLISPSTFASQFTNRSQLNLLARNCFFTSQRLTCQRALILTEALQNKAEENRDFACQTMALGLGSDLIMSQIKKSRGTQSEKMLQKVNQFCFNY